MSGAQLDKSRRFAMIPEALLSDPSLPDAAVRVFGALHRFGRTPDRCFPSVEKIAEVAGTNPSAVKRALNALESAGWIRRVQRTTGRGLKASNGYELHEAPMGRNRTNLTAETPVRQMGRNQPIDGSESNQREGCTPSSLDGSESTHRWVGIEPSAGSVSTHLANRENGGKSPGRPDGSDLTQEREKEPVNERKRNEPALKLVSDEVSPPATDVSAQRFEEEFWPRYPRRHGKRVGKAKALVRWKKLTPSDQDAAIKGVKNYAEHCERTGTYPKDAERWLRDRLWTEWQSAAEPGQSPQAPGPQFQVAQGAPRMSIERMETELGWEMVEMTDGGYKTSATLMAEPSFIEDVADPVERERLARAAGAGTRSA